MLGTIALATLVAIGCVASPTGPTAIVTAMLIDKTDLLVQVAITDGTTLSAPIEVQVGLTRRPSQAVTLAADTPNPTATTQFDDLAPGSYTLTATAAGLTITIPNSSGTITVLPAPTINLDQTYTNTAGSSFQITIAKPLFKVYAITLLDSADAVMSGNIELSIGHATAGDADARLRKGPVTGLSATASPTVGQPLEGGTVWLFLPGDDGTDLPEDVPADFAMLWQTDDDGLIYPSGSNGPLAASLDYTLSVTAPAGRTWQLRITDISATSPPRLPSNIQTRARRGMCDTPVPIPLPGDTVTCDEGGPAASGRGLYLLYNPNTVQSRVRLDRRVLDSDDDRLFDTSLDDGDGLSDTSSVVFDLIRQDCTNPGSSGTSTFFVNAQLSNILFTPTPAAGQVYCIHISGTSATGNIASDNLQFTLNP